MSAREVAEWMRDEVEKKAEIYQDDTACVIKKKFGKEYVYENENGNDAISKSVLTEFRKLTEDTVVWERGYRTWRKRKQYDPPGRQTD